MSVTLVCTPVSGKLKFTWSFTTANLTHQDIHDMTLIVTDHKVSDHASSVSFQSYNISPFTVDPETQDKSLTLEYTLSDVPLGTALGAILSVTLEDANYTNIVSESVTATVKRAPIAPVMEISASDNKLSYKITNMQYLSESDGYSQLTHLEVFYNRGSGVRQIRHIIESSANYVSSPFFEIIDLSNNIDYELSFRLKNAVGYSPMSNTYIATPSNKPDIISYLFANSSIKNLNPVTSMSSAAADFSLNFTDSQNVSLQFVRPGDYQDLINEKLDISSFTIERTTLDASMVKITSSVVSKTITVDGSLNSILNDQYWILDASRVTIKYTDVNVPVGKNYIYGVFATNKFGPGQARECLVRHASLPSAPTITKIDPSNGEVKLTIKKPTSLNGFADISNNSYSYYVSINEVSGNELVFKGYQTASVDLSDNMIISSFTGGSLVNGKQYEFDARIKVDISQNSVSGTDPALTVTQDSIKSFFLSTRSSPGVRSRPYAAPSAVTFFNVSPLDNSSNFLLDPSSQPLDNKAWLKWTDVSSVDNGGVDGTGVIKYKVYKNGIETLTNIEKSPVLIDGNGNGSSMALEVYSYVYNTETGKEILSAPSTSESVIPFKLPLAVTGLTFDASGVGRLIYKYSQLTSLQGGGLPVAYRVTVQDVSSNPTTVLDISGNQLQGEITGLNAGTQYTITVTSQVTFNSRYYYGPSVSKVQTSYIKPASPSSIIVYPNDKGFKLTWDKPTGYTSTSIDGVESIFSNGVKLTGYNIYLDGSLLTNILVNTEYYIASGLTNFRQYGITMATVGVVNGTEVVVGSLSSPTSVIPQAGPGPVTGLVAEPSASSIKFTWNAQGDNDTGVAGFKVFRDGEEIITTSASRTGQKWSYTDFGLTNGTQYFYQFYAVKVVGTTPVISLLSSSNSLSVAPYQGASVLRDIIYETTASGIFVEWNAPLTTGGADAIQGSNGAKNGPLIYTVAVYDLSGNTEDSAGANWTKLVSVVETVELAASFSGLITNKKYKITASSYYMDYLGNKVSGTSTDLFPVTPNNKALNVSGLKAIPEDSKVTLSWTLPNDASDNAAYTKGPIQIYRQILTAAGVTSAEVLYAIVPNNVSSFVDVSGGSVGLNGTFKATNASGAVVAMNGNARLYSAITDSSNLPAATIINGNTYTYSIVLTRTNANVAQPDPVSVTAAPSGKIVIGTINQDMINKAKFLMRLDKNGANLSDFLVVGLLSDASGASDLPVFKGTFSDPVYTGTANPSGNLTALQETDAANQYFDWSFELESIPSDLLVIVENGNGFTIKNWPSIGGRICTI